MSKGWRHALGLPHHGHLCRSRGVSTLSTCLSVSLFHPLPPTSQGTDLTLSTRPGARGAATLGKAEQLWVPPPSPKERLSPKPCIPLSATLRLTSMKCHYGRNGQDQGGDSGRSYRCEMLRVCGWIPGSGDRRGEARGMQRLLGGASRGFVVGFAETGKMGWGWLGKDRGEKSRSPAWP